MKKLILLFTAYLFALQANAQYDVTVAKDGSGNYTTVQAAIDAAPANLTSPYKIFIKAGKYREQITVPSNKPFLEFIGQDVANTKITYGDGAGGTTTFTINSNDCMLMNITLENSQGYYADGPQSLAVKTNNVDRIVFKNCRFISGQDTVYTNGSGKRIYFKNCYIDGNTDFVYGAAIAVFDSCIILPRERVDGSTGGVITAANTPNGQAYGLIFRDCIMPNNRGITRYTLGRPWQNDAGTTANPAYNKTVFLNTTMSKIVILPAGWSTWDASTNTSTITYAEYKSKGFDSSLIDVSQRLPWTQQLTAAQAANYYNNTNLFGTWDPYAVWADLSLPSLKPIALANLRTLRNASVSTIPFNISWPIAGVKYELFRSTDSVNFTKVNEMTIATDTIVATAFTDNLPPVGTSYFYKVTASKTGYTANTTDTIVKVNIAIPLNGEYRSANTGPWSNTVSATTTITSGVVTAVVISASPSGYTAAPTVTFTAAPSGGTTAVGTAILTGGVVTGVNITNPGAGYTAAPAVTFSTTGVGGNSVWEVYNSTTSAWTPVALGTGPSNVSVTIRVPHTISLNTLAGIGSLTIENGATLNSISNALQAATQTLRVGNGTTPVTAVIRNDGIFGSITGTNDGIVVEAASGCSNLAITGTGTTSIARFRPLPGNPYNFNFVIDQNMDFNISNNIGLTGYYSNAGNTAAEVVTITINPNKTVRVTQPGGGFHTAATTSNPGGNITYNINGTLDVSATNNVAMVPNSVSPTSAVTMNIGSQGLVKTGLNFTMTNTAGSAYGTSRVTIDSGGIFDATKTTNFTATNSANSGYVVLNGGLLRRTVANTNVIFPVSPAINSYNPATILNAGTPDKFSLNVRSTFIQPVPDSGKSVRRQWTISEDTVGGSNATVSLAWMAGEQGVSFNPAAAVSIIRYTGTGWQGYPATVSGAGTAASPYVATATGITAFSPFAVINTGALPLKLVSFKAAYKNNGVQTSWMTANEEGTKNFEIERSTDARSFNDAGTVMATNTAGTHSYNFTDANPLKGVSYYRLKMMDIDGKITYSNIVAVNGGENGTVLIYPNPVKDQLQVLHGTAAKSALIKIFTVDGKMLLQQQIAESSRQTVLNISALAAGSYILKLTNGTGQTTTRFSKQ